MSDLVRRSELLEAYDKAHVGPPGGARKLIEEAPAVEAVPVVNGRWIYWCGEPLWKECSVCSNTINSITAADYNYCPCCGAKMDLEVE